MVDNDVKLPKDALLNLMEGNPLVCCGYYAHRDTAQKKGELNKTCACILDGEISYTHQYTMDDMKRLREEGVTRERIHGGGLGCALITTDIFKKMTYPWFDWANYSNGKMLSEDLYFCERCKIAGIPIYVDPRVGCGHLIRTMQEVK